MSAKTAYDFSFRAIDGRDLPLAEFRGKALLVVNVASRCGLTPQYAALEKLWTTRRNNGLVILGVPANDFGAQEPGTEDEIRSFCDLNYQVDFPMTAKEHVIGPEAHPLFKWVATELGEDAAPKWNFHKYLFRRDGGIAGTFGSRTLPDAAEIASAIDAALAS